VGHNVRDVHTPWGYNVREGSGSVGSNCSRDTTSVGRTLLEVTTLVRCTVRGVFTSVVAAFLVLAAAAFPSRSVSLGALAAETQDLAQYVDPFIGTAPSPLADYGPEFDGGDTFPGAVYPAGMLAWSPDTVEHRIPGGYSYLDHTLKGFSLTHFSGRGCTVYQDVAILPGPSPATFAHANEVASPGYYAVTLDSGVSAELTVTPRTGLGRFTFPPGVQPTLTVDAAASVNGALASQVSVDTDGQVVTGKVESQVGCGSDHYTLYFAIGFNQPFAAVTNTGSTVALTFESQTVEVKPSISYVSVDNALENLAAEDPGWDLGAVHAAARAAWNQMLSRIEVSGGSDADLRTFYTALYHTFLEPNVFGDANGEYIGFDDQVHQAPPGHAQYANIAGWDQYRALIQLRSILAPDQASDIVQSLVNDAQQGGGGMPRWEQANRNSAGMVGDSPAVLVANAYAFGARDFDASAALAALDYGASNPSAQSGGHAVREYLDPWLQHGYVPEQPSITLEYASDDFALAQFAQALGRTDLYERYASRAANWRNTFNPASGYAEPRSVGGSFVAPDHGFVEGNAAQYTWMVPFDIAGVAAALGGTDAASARLDAFFTEVNGGPDRPYMWIGNEPNLTTPWAYDALGAPARTQTVVRRIQRDAFAATPGGLPGNDDGGTLSAWYVFAAIGIYPAVPGVGGFATGAPLFASANVHLGNGSVLHITTDAVDAPVSPYLDGAPLSRPWLDWSRVASGGSLEFRAD
jgi:predicted alpha-1,2-mannosidase